jgi:hypothetical protein
VTKKRVFTVRENTTGRNPLSFRLENCQTIYDVENCLCIEYPTALIHRGGSHVAVHNTEGLITGNRILLIVEEYN